jgi:hypothetical protein
MPVTVIGPIVNGAGVCVWRDGLGDPTEVAYVPSFHYLRSQPADLGVHFDHDESWRLGGGRNVYLERNKRGLAAVAVLDSDVGGLIEDGPWYWSPGVRYLSMGDSPVYKYGVKLRELSLTRNPADPTLRPVQWAGGDLSRGECGALGPRGLPLPMCETWRRAAEELGMRRYRASSKTVDIFDVDELDDVSECLTSGGTLTDAAEVLRKRSAPPAAPVGRTTLFGHPLSPEMSKLVDDALHDPTTEGWAITDRIAVAAVRRR